MLGAQQFAGRCGLGESDATALGDAIVGAWDDFLDVVAHADLSRPSRLPGWTGRDTCIHLGSWADHRVLSSILAAALSGGGPEPRDADAANAELVAAHHDATPEEVRAALQRSRDVVEAWFDGSEPAELGRALVRSSVGDLPLLSLLHAGCYELAVHALDLAPCGAPAPSAFLLERGLGALLDVTGALAARHDIDMTVTAQTPQGGWSFSSSTEGWAIDQVAAGPFEGVGVRATAADLLDASAGRTTIPALLLSRRMVVQQLPSFMRLAPIISEVPGLPGGASLRAGVVGLTAVTGGVGKLIGRLKR
ncbi:MAG: hypothetical protein JWM02_3565 [Frankiales bacterium]|nr:hypothetical protein [Frankiales bacterium]